MSEGSVSPAPTRASTWEARRIAGLVTGGLLFLIALVLLGAGGTALWADLTQREGGYVTTDAHEFSTSGYALATKSTHLGSPGVGWLYAPGILGKLRIRVTPLDGRSPLFVGIGPTADVDRYLAGVDRTVIDEFFGDKTEEVAGRAPAKAPGTGDFWVASSTGRGERTVTWNPHNGSWTVVVMNAGARENLAIRADLGARMPPVVWIAIGLLVIGVVFLVGGGLLLAGAIRGRTARLATRERRSGAEH